MVTSVTMLRQRLSSHFLDSVDLTIDHEMKSFFDAESIHLTKPSINYDVPYDQPLTQPSPSSAPTYHFPHLTSAISKISPPVFVKLNNTAPTDASWLFGSLQVYDAPSAMALIKASDRCCEVMADHSVISVTKYIEIPLFSEFRLFVKDGFLYCICQRHYQFYFSEVVSKIDQIENIFTKFISNYFPILSVFSEILVFNVCIDILNGHINWLNPRIVILDIELIDAGCPKFRNLDLSALSQKSPSKPSMIINTTAEASISSSVAAFPSLPLEMQQCHNEEEMMEILRSIKKEEGEH
ncbi:hypothetical protein P9112_008338 [Eukaryota sp. TZLM1-RC]